MGWTQNRIWFNWKGKFSHCTNYSCSPYFVERHSTKLYWKYQQSCYPGSWLDKKTANIIIE